MSMPSILLPFPRDLAECARQRRKRMASYAQGAGQTYQHSQQQHHHQYQPSWSLNDLSTELLALIFEQVGDDPSSGGSIIWFLS